MIVHGSYDHIGATTSAGTSMVADYQCPVLCTFAAVYADHPDYDQAWRVDTSQRLWHLCIMGPVDSRTKIRDRPGRLFRAAICAIPEQRLCDTGSLRS